MTKVSTLRCDGITIHKKRPLIDLDSKLRDIPPAMARDVLPHVTWYGFEPCWIWFGSVDGRGHPIFRRKRPDTGKVEQFSVRRLVAGMFWEFGSDVYCKMSCENLNCVNPGHIVLTGDKWR